MEKISQLVLVVIELRSFDLCDQKTLDIYIFYTCVLSLKGITGLANKIFYLPISKLNHQYDLDYKKKKKIYLIFIHPKRFLNFVT